MHLQLPRMESALDRIGAELAAVSRLEFLPEAQREPFAFALRGWVACMLALYFAYTLELDQPYWAGMTVWMVIQPAPGMAISKGFYRIVGTIIGAAMGVVLISFFSQTPELYLLSLALWLALCTLIANLVTNFRQYGAVLAGYTAAIVSLGAYGDQGHVFDVATARGAATLIGIVCAMGVSLIFAPHRAEAAVIAQLSKAVADTARRASIPLEASFAERVGIGRPVLALLIGLDAQIEYGAAESSRLRIHAGMARSLVAHLFAVLAAKRAMEEHLGRVGLVQDSETVAVYHETMTLLADVPTMLDARQLEDVAGKLRTLNQRVWELKPEHASSDREQQVSSRLVVDRLTDLLLHYERAVANVINMLGGWKRDPVLHLNFHRDHMVATINAARAFITVIIAGAFWIQSEWSSGPQMLIQFAVGSSLFSTAPEPTAVSHNFMKGVILGTIMAYVCTYHFLTNIDGFIPFALVQGLFLIPGAMMIMNPKLSAVGLAYCVFFIVVERPVNPMNYDPSSFFNNALATVVGAGLGTMGYFLFMPANPKLARRYVVRRIRKGLRMIAVQNPIPPYWEWQTRMFDRVYRLYNPKNPAANSTDEWYEGGLSALHLGNEVLRLRHLIEEGTLPERAETLARSVVNSFGEILTEPDSTRFTIQAVSATLQETEPPQVEEGRRAWCRFQGIVEEMEAFFLEYPRFLTPARKRVN